MLESNRKSSSDLKLPKSHLQLIGVLLAIFTFGSVLALVYYIDLLWMREHKQNDNDMIAERLNRDAIQLITILDSRLQLTRGLEAAVRTDADQAMRNFDQISSALIGNLNGIISLQLAPNGVIMHVTNPEKNKAAIGHDLFSDPKHKAIVERARDRQEYVIEGPINLLQGGQAIIARRPIFLQVTLGNTEVFWGFATVLIDVPILLKEAGLFRPIQGVSIAVRRKNNSETPGKVFYGDPNVFQNADAHVEVNLPNVSWQLGAKRVSGMPDFPQRYWLWLLGVITGVLVGYGVYTEFLRRDKLQLEVRNATAKLATVNEQLKLERDLLDMAISSSRLATWKADLRTGQISLDKYWAQMMGETSTTQNITVDELLARVPAKQRRKLRSLTRDLMKGHITLYDVEHQYRTGGGELRWIRGRGKIIAWNRKGRPLTMIGTNEDITERKKVEEEMRKLNRALEQSPVTVLITNLNGNIEYVNPAFTRTSGYTPEEVLGKIPKLLRSGETTPAKSKELWDALTGGREWQGEILSKKKNGELYWEFVSAAPVRNENGEITHYLSVQEDITERKRTSQELVKAKELSEQANQAKSQFLSMMSHELRTPLNAIIGFSEMLYEETKHIKEQKTLSSDLRKIYLSGQHLLEVINDILDLSKIEAGKMDLETIPLSLTDIVEGSAQTIAHTAIIKGLRLITYVDPALPPFVTGDPIRLRQILINLAGNAIKFSDEGEIVIQAELVEDNDIDRITVCFSVKDQGIGISEDDMKKLFQAFSQVESSTTRIFGGTGLGLSICQRLANMMGGEIGINSQLGKGSEFYVTVPFNKSDKVHEHKEAGDLKGVRILLIVKSATEQSIYRRYLEYWQADVTLSDDLGTCYEQCLVAQREGKPFNIVLIGPQWRREERFEVCNLVTKQPTLSKTKFVSLLKGRQSQRIQGSSHYVCLDVDPVWRAQLLAVVASAAGRESPEIFNEGAPVKLETGRNQTVTQAGEEETLILVAEDNPTNRDVISRQLNILGYTCEIAESGKEAWNIWHPKKYAMLLTDCHMPNMDGIELTDVIRKAEKGTENHTPIIGISADTRKEAIERYLVAGMDDYLSKPFKISELRKILQKWMPHQSQPTKLKPASTTTETKKPFPESGIPSNYGSIDERVLKDMFGDDQEMFKEILNDFVDATQKIIKEIKTGWQEHSAETVKQGAHKLKSAARAVGANDLADVSLSLETAGNNEDWKTINNQSPGLDELMLEIEEYVSQL